MDSINKRIVERFQPTLDIIQRQTACEHKWPDKQGVAYYRCSICGSPYNETRRSTPHSASTNIKFNGRMCT